jgi:ribosome maturation factor RimP
MTTEQINEIKKLAQPIVEQEDLFLVDVEVKGGNETILWVYVDSENSYVSVEACTKISRELGFVLDAHDVITSKYRLNVSSPGLSRPLTDIRQYKKNRGRTAKVKYKTPEGYLKIEGVLHGISGDTIELIVNDQNVKTIELDSIVETKIIPKIK